MNRRLLLGSLALLLIGAPARGASTGGSENFDVALVSEYASIRPAHPFYVGLRMEPKPGWHTYWKNPGDAGLPLRIEWTLPPGFTAGPIEWPAPVRFETGPLVSYGYDREVLLAVRITPPAAISAKAVTIAGTFDWLECEEVCVAGSATLDLALPVSDPARDGVPREAPAARLFAAARASRPAAVPEWNLSAEAGPRAIALEIRSPRGASAQGGYFFADQPLVADYAAAQGFESLEDGHRLTVPPAPNRNGFPERLTGVLVLEGSGPRGSRAALEVDVPLSAGDPAPASAQQVTASAEPHPPAASSRTPRIPVGAMAGAVALGGLGFILLRRRQRRTQRDPREKT